MINQWLCLSVWISCYLFVWIGVESVVVWHLGGGCAWWLVFFFFFSLFCWWFLPWWGSSGCCLAGVCGGGCYLAGHVWWWSAGSDWFTCEIEIDWRDKDKERKEWKRYNFFKKYLYGLYYFNELDVKIETEMLEEL